MNMSQTSEGERTTRLPPGVDTGLGLSQCSPLYRVTQTLTVHLSALYIAQR
jgi:hypothetical protein